MRVPVMSVRHVRMRVRHRPVMVTMGVRFRSLVPIMAMSMVFIVDMDVIVIHRIMRVGMVMLASDEEPGSSQGQSSAGDRWDPGDFPENEPSERYSGDRGQREQGGSPCGIQMSEGQDEENQRCAIAQRSDQGSADKRFNRQRRQFAQNPRNDEIDQTRD